MSEFAVSFGRVTAVMTAVMGALATQCGPIEDGPAQGGTVTARAAQSGGERVAESPSDAEAFPRVPRSVVQINERTERDGAAERVTPPSGALEWGVDAGPVVYSDAGTRAAELAWLVTRIDEGADSAGPAGPPNVRALVGYGPDGARALVPLFRAGDARRVPFARKVIEGLARRACRAVSDPLAPRRVVAWIESGVAELAPATPNSDPLTWPWARGPQYPWLPSSLARLRAWADQGLPCVSRGTSDRAAGDEDDDDDDAPSRRAMDAGVARRVDAGRALLDSRAP